MVKLSKLQSASTPFGEWVLGRLTQQGKNGEHLLAAMKGEAKARRVLHEYGVKSMPNSSTTTQLLDLLGVPLDELNARLLGREPESASAAPAIDATAARLAAWLPRILPLFEGHVRVLTVLGDHLPRIAKWDAELDPEVSRLADELRPKLRLNQAMLLVSRSVDWSSRPLTLPGLEVDFAYVQALRKLGQRPPVLSASGVVTVAQTPGLALHLRAPLSATYKECFHTLGGALHPDDASLERVGADRTLHDTLERELVEEARIRVDPEGAFAVLLEEERTGFIQYLALDLTTARLPPEHNAEGIAQLVTFDRLLEALLERKWVPTGRLSVLLWLAAGAPGAGPRAFAGLGADDVLQRVLATPLVHADP
ncbi:MAG: hypothetical protein IT385_22950 [Deltaproteobacteria bacterium]|nr:hypothetical protein [Deltaproteobacteria bacterium]